MKDGRLYFRAPWFPTTSKLLVDRAKNMVSLKNNVDFKAHLGSILSGGFLMDDSEFKGIVLEAVKQFDVVGGEMESYGIYKSVIDNKLKHCITIKGICDWGEKKNELSDNPEENSKIKDKHQLLASKNAVTVCYELLSEEYTFQDIGVLSISEIDNTEKNVAQVKKNL
jgi:nucleoside phosphorylase